MKKERGAALGIPQQFDVTIDQMSWLTDLPKEDHSWEEYSQSLKAGGFLIPDPIYGGDFTWVLELLGLEKHLVEWEADEHYGYSPASIYKKGDVKGLIYEAVLQFHKLNHSILSHVRRMAIDLDTVRGLQILAKEYPDFAEKLIEDLEIMINKLENTSEEFEQESAPTKILEALKQKSEHLKTALPKDSEESKVDPSEIAQQERDVRWVQENTNPTVSARDLWSNFNSKSSDYMMPNAMFVEGYQLICLFNIEG